MNKGKRNYELDFWKFVFTVVILLFHSHKLICSDGNPNLLIKGYVGVEFFFMVSGYLMMSGIIRNQQKGITVSHWQFILNKIKALFPGILFAFAVNFIVWNGFCEPKDIKHSLLALLYALPELMFFRYSGIRFATHFYNGPTWYISAMLLAMFVIYPIAKRYKEKFGLYLAPIISVSFFAWESHGTANLNLTHEWLKYINGGLTRGIAGICAGVFIYYASEFLKNNARQINKIGNTLLLLSEVVISAALFVFMRNSTAKEYGRANDVIAVVYIAILLLIVLSKNNDENRFLSSKPMQFLYKLSLPLFLNQRVIIYYLEATHPEITFKEAFVIYLCITVILSLISLPVTKLIEFIGRKLLILITTKES